MSTKTEQRASKSGKPEVDPEELQRQKFRVKCRFRAFGRLALANAYWLNDELEQYKGVDDVKKRVAQAMRGPVKKKRLLSLTDKALLNKPAKDRTDHEKRYIYRIIGGLKCFKRYPNHVKKKLAAVTYFMYYGPGRVIVRQHHEAHAMYFIVNGDVSISHLIFDGLLNKDVPVEIGMMRAGDLFGEVSLLHDIPRTATCTTISHCEMLVLKKEDFKSVLRATIQQSWDEVNRAMSFFTYFDSLDEVARREGCIMAKMKSYAVNDIILGDGAGVPNFVYFILTGSCEMIESLQIFSFSRTGRTFYRLYDPHVSEEEIEQDLDNKYFTEYHSSIDEQTNSFVTTKPENSSINFKFKVLDSIMKMDKEGKSSKHDGNLPKHEDSKVGSRVLIRGSTRFSIDSGRGSRDDKRQSLVKIKARSSVAHNSSINMQEILHAAEAHRESVRFSVNPPQIETIPSRSKNLRTYFMKVCQFNPGSTFGFGENMRDRRIVAMTPVECMLLPKIWLQQRNSANIWSRIQHFLERKIPKKKQLFEIFASERRWEEYRDQLVNDVVSRSNTVNWTSLHDVPYSIRMEELIDV